MLIVLLVVFYIIIDIFLQFLTFSNFELFEHNRDFLNSNLTMMASSCCGRQEEPAILIFRLLLRMRGMYGARIRLDFYGEWMDYTERNLITRVLTNCHMKRTQSTAIEQKRFDLRSLSPALCNLCLLLVILCFSLPTCHEKKLRPLGQPLYTLSVFLSTGSSRRVVADWESSFGQAGVGAWAEEIWANLKATFNSQRCVFAIGTWECMATNTAHPYTRQIQREKTSGQSTGFV